MSAGPQSRIGHTVRDKRLEADLRPKGHDRATANVGGHGLVSFDPQRFGARKLGEGAYGATYAVDVDGRVLDFLTGLMVHARHRVMSKTPKAFQTVVVKVARGRGNRFVDASAREAGVHKHLSKKCARTSCGTVCAPVPEFYFAGMGADGAYYTVMGMAEGKSLYDAMRAAGGLDARLYVAVERAIAGLWMAGVLHSDFHGDNAMVAPGGAVKVIDFGFGVLMPDSLRNRVRKAVAEKVRRGAACLGEVWDDHGLTAYANRVQHTRDAGVEWYNPEGKALKDLYNGLTAVEAAKVPSERRRAWKC